MGHLPGMRMPPTDTKHLRWLPRRTLGLLPPSPQRAKTPMEMPDRSPGELPAWTFPHRRLAVGVVTLESSGSATQQFPGLQKKPKCSWRNLRGVPGSYRAPICRQHEQNFSVLLFWEPYVSLTQDFSCFQGRAKHSQAALQDA